MRRFSAAFPRSFEPCACSSWRGSRPQQSPGVGIRIGGFPAAQRACVLTGNLWANALPGPSNVVNVVLFWVCVGFSVGISKIEPKKE